MIRFLGRIGKWGLEQVRDLQHVLSVLTITTLLAARPRFWPRTVRNVLARQILFTGFEAMSLVASIAFVAGISIVVQAHVWLAKVGQTVLLGPLLVVIVLREIAPLLANLVIIIRSASAVAAEMANMKLSGEVRLLDAQGLDPMVYLVMPRMIGMAICALGLALVFVVVSLTSGYFVGILVGPAIRPSDFANSVLGSIGVPDVLNLLIKSTLPGALTAVICCTQGFGIGVDATDLPRATSRGLSRSVIAMFATAAIVSMVTYL